MLHNIGSPMRDCCLDNGCEYGLELQPPRDRFSCCGNNSHCLHITGTFNTNSIHPKKKLCLNFIFSLYSKSQSIDKTTILIVYRMEPLTTSKALFFSFATLLLGLASSYKDYPPVRIICIIISAYITLKIYTILILGNSTVYHVKNCFHP